MAFFKVSTQADEIRDTGDSSNYLNKSGMYDIIINDVIVEQSPNGSQYLNLWINHKGTNQLIYNAMRLTNNDGSVNLGAKLFNKLCVITGASENDEIPDPISKTLPIGKGNENKECMVLELFEKMPVKIRLQIQYRMFEGKIMMNRNIKNFFRYEDNATASEIINNSNTKGKQYQQEMEYAENTVYLDGLTAEDVATWQKLQRDDGKKEEKPVTSKRFFSRKS